MTLPIAKYRSGWRWSAYSILTIEIVHSRVLVEVQSKSHSYLSLSTCTRDFGHETLVSLVTRDQNPECEHESTSGDDNDRAGLSI